MKKTRQIYDRDFNISVLAELEAGKPLAQIAREYGIHPSLPCWWKAELAENPEKAFRGNGNKYKDQAKIAELERLLGQAHTEIELIKKSLLHDPKEGTRGETKAFAKKFLIYRRHNPLLKTRKTLCQRDINTNKAVKAKSTSEKV